MLFFSDFFKLFCRFIEEINYFNQNIFSKPKANRVEYLNFVDNKYFEKLCTNKFTIYITKNGNNIIGFNDRIMCVKRMSFEDGTISFEGDFYEQNLNSIYTLGNYFENSSNVNEYIIDASIPTELGIINCLEVDLIKIKKYFVIPIKTGISSYAYIISELLHTSGKYRF